MLCAGVLSQTADTTVNVWSALLPQLLSLAGRLGVVVHIASTTLEIYTSLKGQNVLKGGRPSKKMFRVRDPILSLHIPVLFLDIYFNWKWIFTRWQWYYHKTQHTNNIHHTK
jgi:hypothetical protein